MPIKDTNKTETPYIVDRDEDVFIGLDIPLHRCNDGNGIFAATSTTLEAVKVNIRNLLQTEQNDVEKDLDKNETVITQKNSEG